MIIGSGNIAKCLTDREGAIFFASGVSNSSAHDTSQFHREWGMIYEHVHKTDCFFYFSSARLNFTNEQIGYTPYEWHKVKIERYIREYFENYVILRIGNLIGDTNPNTFINYIKDRQSKGLSVEIKDEYRYMIDGATLNTLCQTLPLNQKIELTVATKIAKVRELL